ncbi:ABC transporter permease [Nisaea acidiphila]|uniref:ABC transporter permease n=1 Tax=Nisaea acidiphila TaxID=1862145 RepID=A0A9J7APF3_9PROT|nr:ABC transporter permease [Nisaea acidiphila]UUX49499.1 ABC transporter permease [Nisaea acidiphila]
MTATDAMDLANETPDVARAARRDRIYARITRADRYLNLLALGWVTPILKMAAGDSPAGQIKELWRGLGLPALGIALFLALWAATAPMVQTSLGTVPGPTEVWEQVENLYADHLRERDKEAAFYERQEKRNAKLIAAGKADKVKERSYTGKPTYFDQIVTSLKTVALGFIIATIFAVPIGVICGLSRSATAALNPLIQIFKPVSPLAWLPIVTMIVSALSTTNSELFPKSFVISAVTVTLCSLWPTLINTSLGVASIEKDLINVGRVLNLSWSVKVLKLVLPSALPLIFTGLRLSLGVGWMVLIAAEMLAQNPGLGKFVWDEFQNGSSQSLAKIMVAVFTIGIIGFLLDRVMMALQTMFSFSETR